MLSSKRLRFVITMGTARFDSEGSNRITIEGFRAIADIDKAGGMMMSTLRAKIYGVSQADMNTVTTLQWKPTDKIANVVEVFAVEDDVDTLVFAGNIINAWGDYQSMPDVYLHIQAQAAYFNQLLSSKPRSFKGAVDVAKVMGQIATDLGYVFENNGVAVRLSDVYLASSGIEQARDLAKQAGIVMEIDDRILSIRPMYEGRRGPIPSVSSASGLVGYPTFDGIGVNFQTLFNPAITFGGRVRLVTDQTHAAGEWIVTCVNHRLESEKPGGAWFSIVRGNASGLAIIGR